MYRDLAGKCAAYDERIHVRQWKTVYVSDFSIDKPATWRLIEPAGQEEKHLKREKDGDKHVLIVDMTGASGALLALGPEISGDFAIELQAKQVGGRVCDLSILTNGIGRGPGFQLGGQDNTQTILWNYVDAATGAQDGTTTANSVGGAVRIVPQKWHRVQLGVVRGQMQARVDGQTIRTMACGPARDPRASLQPIFYTFGSKVAIASVKVSVEEVVRADVDADKIWREIFVDQTREAASTQLAELTQLLGDATPATRRLASELLARAGRLAIPALEGSMENGVPEEQARARRILEGLDVKDLKGKMKDMSVTED